MARGGADQGLALLLYLAERLLQEGMQERAAQLLHHRGGLASALPGMEDLARESFQRVLHLAPDHPEATAALLALERPAIPAPPDEEAARQRTRTEGLVTQVLRLSLEMDEEQPVPALRGELESALSNVRDWPSFLEDLRQKGHRIDDVDLKTRILLQGGQICEKRLGDPLQAEEWYGRVLELDNNDPIALDALIRLLGTREAWPGLVDLLLRRAGQARDTGHWAELLVACADVLGRRMGDHFRATAVLRAVIEVLPHHREARSLLTTSLEAEGRFGEALEVLGSLEEVTEGAELINLLERKAQMLLGPLGRPAEGIRHLVRILKLDPDNEGALATLDEFYIERGNPKMELAVVERRLANLIQRGGGREDDLILRSTLFLRRGRLRLQLRGEEEAQGARRDFEMALREWRGNAEAAEELAVIYRQEKNAEGLRRVLPLLADLMLPGPSRTALEQEIGSLGEGRSPSGTGG